MVLMRGWFRSCSRCLLLVPLLLNGCALFPGMYASYSKPAEVIESVEEPNTVDYKLLKVTPLLVRQLQEEVKAAEFSIKGQLLKSDPPSYPYRLGPQDAVSISVWGYDEFGSGTAINTNSVSFGGAGGSGTGRTIDAQGNVFVPLVGEVKASGFTVNGFRRELQRSLSAYLKGPQVEVSVTAYRSQKVFIAGEVGRPGVVAITDQPLTLVNALSQTGGPTEAADFYNVALTRGSNRIKLNIDRLYFGGDTSINVLLKDGDVISVPDRMDRKVFILGEVGNSVGVNQARAYVMRRGKMSLTEVLSDAGGMNPFSSAASQVYVIRANPSMISPTQAAMNPIVYNLDASNPEALVLADQFPMQPRDVVFVNPTGPTVIGRFIGQFLPILLPAILVSDNPI
jgi:polysaccharide export outer membrane protein